MKYAYLYFILFLSSILNGQRYITYEFNGGRFGDCLSTFCKAKWFSYKYNLTLLYKPFEYSDQLMLHTIETLYDKTYTIDHQIVKVQHEVDIAKNKQDNVLFVSNFYSQTPGIYEYALQNAAFERDIKKALTPIDQKKQIEKIDGIVTAAVHVRKGGGFDKPLSSDSIHKKENQYADQIWPTKFPPDHYYIDQIKTLKKLIAQDARLTIYFFTDDKDPAALVKKYKEVLHDDTITFIYRTQDNSHDTNVVEDFYVMAQCDCLIRSSSLFAKAAQLLGNHSIIMYPVQGIWQDGHVIIDPVGIIIRDATKKP